MATKMADNNGQDDTIQNNESNVDASCEYDSDEEDDYTYFDNKVYQRLKQNDSTITKVHVELNFDDDDQQYYFNSIDWRNDGDCIYNNTHLKVLKISYNGTPFERSDEQPYILGEQGNNLPTRQQLQAFFSCIYRNSSIKQLAIDEIGIVDEFGEGLIQGLCGHSSLTRLDIELGYDTIDQSRLGSAGCTAIGKVLKHPQSKLIALRLPYSKPNDEGLDIICDSLLGNSTLKRLCLDGNDNITLAGWRALSNVIQHPKCRLIHLQLFGTEINDESADMLGSSLRGSSIKNLNLSDTPVSNSGWQILFNQLSQTSIVRLDLNYNNIGNAGLAALANIGTLKSLGLSSEEANPTGWQSFFNSLQSRGTQLVKLDISSNQIGNEGTAALGNLLFNMNTLKTLNMNGIDSISPQGWVSFFNALQDSNLNLVELNLGTNNIDDEAMQLLVPLVSSMRQLKKLDLGCNVGVSPVGWQALTGYLQSLNVALEYLDIDENKINDETVIAFASALTNNKTLKRLYLNDCCDEDDEDDNELITERGWKALSALVCNKTSIMSTYNSNHTLQDIGHDYVSNDDDEVSSLNLNRNEDKEEVARQKILKVHFSDNDASNMQVLLDMELEMMPSVIAWIGRPTYDDWSGRKVSGLSLLYNLMRRLPDLFDSSAHKKRSTAAFKRKRDM